MSESTSQFYNRSASDWVRSEPLLLSDFTARPFLLDLCEPIAGKDILDLGCGEGYVTRQLKQRGAARLEGVDISEQMIERACMSERAEPLGIRYQVGNAVDLSCFPDRIFDLVVAVFLFNYLTTAEMILAMQEVMRMLRPSGHFVFAVPHPFLMFVRAEEPPFYFQRGDAGYFSGCDHLFEGHIRRRDGIDVPVRCVHKTFEVYFRALAVAGFSALPEVHELHVEASHLTLDAAFFEPVREQPLHLAFRICA